MHFTDLLKHTLSLDVHVAFESNFPMSRSSLKMTNFTLLVIVTSLLGICQISKAWKNDWNRLLHFKCPENQHIQWFKSQHDTGREDRQFDMSCRPGFVGTDCGWTGYLNRWNEVVNFVCPDNGVVTGFYGIYSDRDEDRRWELRCCKLVTKPGQSCYWTNWLATWHYPVDNRFPPGQAMTGMYSVYNNRKDDRLFKFRMCLFTNCKAVGMKILDRLESTYTGSRVVGIASTQGCSYGQEFMLNLGGTDSVEETCSFTTTNDKSFTFDTALSVTAETSAKFLGTGGSVSFAVSQSSRRSTKWGSSYEKATSIGRESSASTDMTFTGPGAGLIMADVREYRMNADNVKVEYDVRCDDGTRRRQRDVIDNFSLKTYGVTHFSSYTGQYTPGRCSWSTYTCTKQLRGKKASSPDQIVKDFKACFRGGRGTVTKK
ncbi:uncharacterized protein LOC141910143 [Tubulanus polymorphus]|uniref:uncharacterized protein LOC141910143 n=1 Tax=Tubulanus polymorphus TaxID=672921 RepID=UPI003DA513E7